MMRPLAASIALVLVPAALGAQPAPPTATTVESLLAFPTFFHLKQVVVRGELRACRDTCILVSAEGEAGPHVLLRSGVATEGPAQVVGQFWDVGRMTPDDPRFAGLDAVALIEPLSGGQWPGPGHLLFIGAASVAEPTSFPAPTLRAIALEPGRYEGQRVTVAGRFGGRNLYGDLPKPPGISRWDFVLRSAGAAVWVTNLRPRGQGFDLDPMAKVDTGRWLEVSGVVRKKGALVRIDAAAIAQAKPAEEAVETAQPAIPPGPPPEVRFSLPSEGETDVSPATTVRMQVTRDLDEATLTGRVRVSYVEPPSGAARVAPIQHAEAWDTAGRVLTIKFASPLERFRAVRVELLAGIQGTDGQPLKPWTLTFTTGAQGPD